MRRIMRIKVVAVLLTLALIFNMLPGMLLNMLPGLFLLEASAVTDTVYGTNSYQIQAADTPTLELVSQSKPATADSVPQASGNVEYGNDGDPATRWIAPDNKYPRWWRVDLGQNYNVRKVDISWNNSGARVYYYEIMTSTDDVNYERKADKTGNTVSGDTTDSFSAVARYIKINVTGGSYLPGNAAFSECKVYADTSIPVPAVTPPPEVVSQGKPCVADSASQTDGNVEYGNDGNTATKWIAPDNRYPRWWRVDLGHNYDLKKVEISWNNASARIYYYEILTSSDDKDYVRQVNKQGNTVSGNTTDDLSVSARYVKINVTGTSYVAGNAAFFECKVYADTASTPAYVTSPTLSRNNTDVRVNQVIELNFDKVMDGNTLIPANFSIDGNAVIENVIKDSSNPKKCQIKFVSNLEFEKTYKLAILDGVKDQFAHSVAPDSREFTFTVMPRVVALIDSLNISKNGIAQNAITDGILNISATVESFVDSTDVAFMAILYQGNTLQKIALDSQQALTMGNTKNFNCTITVPTGNNYHIDMFSWDKVQGMKLITSLYRLDSTGLNEVKSAAHPSATSINELNVSYNRQTFKVELSGKTDKDPNEMVTVLIAKDGVDLGSTDVLTNINNNVAFIGHYVTTAGGSFSDSNIQIDDTRFGDGDYTVYAGTEKTGFSVAKTFYFATPTTITWIIESLNSPDLTETAAQSIIENPILGLNLEDYNLSYTDKSHIVKLFIGYRQSSTNLSSVQQVVDKATGVELFNKETDKSKIDRWIKKYGVKILGSDNILLNKYLNDATLSQDVKNVICEGLISRHGSLNDGDDVGRAFAETSIPAIVSDKNNTWAEIQTYLTDISYKNYLQSYMTIDVAPYIANAGVNPVDVYKAMLDYTYEDIAQIQQKVVDIVAGLKGRSTERGGSSGGGSGRSASYTADSIPAFTPSPTPPEDTDPTDLGTVPWAVESIHTLIRNKVISPADRFRPDDSITREEFTKMAVMAFGYQDTDAQCEFDDVDTDQWSYPYVAAAKKNGIINGITDSVFGAGQTISRQEMAAIIFRAITKKHMVNESVEETGDFADAGDIDQYALDSVKVMRALGIIKGADDNLFLPKDMATRAQAATIIHKAQEILQREAANQ